MEAVNFSVELMAVLFLTGLTGIGLIMACGQMIGASFGSHLAIKNGARIIRPLYLTVVFATIVRLLYTNFIIQT